MCWGQPEFVNFFDESSFVMNSRNIFVDVISNLQEDGQAKESPGILY